MSFGNTVDQAALDKVMSEAKRVAKDYRRVTGRPLGITGEVGEYEAMRLLGLKLAVVRQVGFDAVEETPSGPCRLQIKTRCVADSSKGRLSRISLEDEWDAVLLVLVDQSFEVTAIHRADRPAVEAALLAPGSKSRNERGALGLSKFKSIARVVWKR